MTVTNSPQQGAYGSYHRPICPEGRSARTTPSSGSEPCVKENRPFVLAATILGSAMAFIDGTVVTIALPVLQSDLGASFEEVQWVVNAYALFLGTLILIGGAAGDAYGQRRIFILGVNVFALASVFCAVAPSGGALIAARAVQGIGAALMVPQSLALLATHFPEGERGRAIGIWAGASALTTALGPPIGGLMIDWFDWRSVFWINFPAALIVLYLTHRFIPEEPDGQVAARPDWLGGALALIAFGGLTAGLTWIADNGASLFTLLVILAGLCAFPLFWLRERYHHQPLVPVDLFKDRTFLAANMMTVFLYGALAAVLFLLPFELIERRQFSPSEVGAALLPFGLIIGVFSRRAGRWSEEIGPRLPLAFGSITVAAATALLALALENFWIGIFGPIVLMSAGMALVVSPLTTTVMNAAPMSQSGVASGINNAASRLAGLLAIVLVGLIASYIFANELSLVGLDGETFSGAPVHMGDLPPVGSAARSVIEIAFGRAYAVGVTLASFMALLSALIALYGLPRRDAAPIEDNQ